MGVVPSGPIPNGSEALDRLLDEVVSVSIAVAFVSESGVSIFADLLERHSVADVELVARGAPITDPTALERARELGWRISVITGHQAIHFHPKLWLLEAPHELRVLAGSGNLTGGGLIANREQFDVTVMSDPNLIEIHQARYEDLTAGAISLDQIKQSIAWTEWMLQMPERKNLRSRLDRLDEKLARSPAIDRQSDKEQLIADLEDVHARMVAADLRRQDGQKYMPNRLKQGIDRAKANGDPVRMVARMCRRQTKGFDVILDSGEYDLTVEALVVDTEKVYYDLFEDETRRLSAERLEKFPTWQSNP
jgi:hypothetical protein